MNAFVEKIKTYIDISPIQTPLMAATFGELPLEAIEMCMAKAGIMAHRMPTKRWYDHVKLIAKTPAMLVAYLRERDESYNTLVRVIEDANGTVSVEGKEDAIHVAVTKGHADVVDLLLKSGMDIYEFTTDEGSDLLDVAMMNRDIHTMSLLYAHGATIVPNIDYVPHVIDQNWEDVARWLLAHDTHLADAFLEHGFASAKMRYVWMALQAGANTDFELESEVIAQYNRVDVLRLAMDLGVNVSRVYGDAMRANNVRMIEFLKENGVMPNLHYTDFDHPISAGHHKAVLAVVSAGADCGIMAKNALIHSNVVPLEEVVRVLSPSDTKVAYPVALRSGNMAAICALIERNVDPTYSILLGDWYEALLANHLAVIVVMFMYFPDIVPSDVIHITVTKCMRIANA